MAIHITELDIERYRGIIGMDLREFNHINIFTGKNNSGKTSILEALCMVGDPIQLLSWFNISYAARFGGKSTYTELLRMFPFDDEKKISFSFNLREKIHRLDASGTEIPSRVPKDELMRLNGYMATGAPKPENREMLDMMYLEIEINYDGYKSETGVFEEQNRIVENTKLPNDTINCFYISQNEKVGGYLDIIANVLKDNHYRNILIEVLRQFDNNIESISMIGNELFIYSNKHRQAIPLGVYGTGMKKAVFILAVIIQNKNGCVMIDEFETGIHEEAIERLFRLIFNTADEQNVQLFLSTHNSAAVERLTKIEDFSSKANLYTLYEDENRQFVRRLAGFDIKRAIELGVAIR